MTVEELYAQIGGNYTEALSRMPSEAFVSRFIIRFLDDTSCKDLFAAWASGDDEVSFRAAHTAKGVCANLALTKLCDLSTQICEALRPGNESLRAQTDIDALVSQLSGAYASTVAAIETYRDQQ